MKRKMGELNEDETMDAQPKSDHWFRVDDLPYLHFIFEEPIFPGLSGEQIFWAHFTDEMAFCRIKGLNRPEEVLRLSGRVVSGSVSRAKRIKAKQSLSSFRQSGSRSRRKMQCSRRRTPRSSCSAIARTPAR